MIGWLTSVLLTTFKKILENLVKTGVFWITLPMVSTMTNVQPPGFFRETGIIIFAGNRSNRN